MPTAVVRLSSNENPYGPSAKALDAMNKAFNLSCRYPDEHNGQLIEALAKLNSVNRDQILLGDGSSEILEICAEAFTGPVSNGKTGLGRGTLANVDVITKVSLMPGGTHVATLANGQKLQVSRLQSRILRDRLLKL